MPFVKTLSSGKREVQVRAFLATIFAVALVVGFFMKLVTQDAFLGIATMCITYYFSKRNIEDNKPPNPPV